MKPEIILNQIVIASPNEAPSELFNIVGCVLIRAANDAEYQALLTLKAECEKDAGWLCREYTPESVEDEITLKLATSQLMVKDFLTKLSFSNVLELSRLRFILRPHDVVSNLHIGNSTNNE